MSSNNFAIQESGPDQKSHIDAKGFREDKNIPAGRPGRDEDMAQVNRDDCVAHYHLLMLVSTLIGCLVFGMQSVYARTDRGSRWWLLDGKFAAVSQESKLRSHIQGNP